MRDRQRPRRWRSLLPFAALWYAAVAINLALDLNQSYLLERGYYRLGWHMVPNLADYLVSMVMPFGAVAGGSVRAISTVLGEIARLLAPLRRWQSRSFAPTVDQVLCGFGRWSLLAFLPFTFEPTSRYTYLSAAGFAPVLAVGALALQRRSTRAGVRSVTLAVVAGGLLSLLALTDTMIVDNDYEYGNEWSCAWSRT